jgi:cytochrome c553
MCLSLTVIVSAAAATAIAADNPEWAYPPIRQPANPDNTVKKSVPGSSKHYTQAQIDDPFNPPDWFPNEHPPMPQIVAHGGQRPAGRACAQCHLPTGNGHPESASVAGLPVDYIARQMAEFKTGRRAGPAAGAMIAVAQVVAEDDIDAAADYFSKLKPTTDYNKVVEADTVPKSYVGAGGMRLPAKDGGTEPLGNRIIALPVDANAAVLRDPHSGFVYFVPQGSIAKGEALVTTGGDGKTVGCTLCHGQALKGMGEVPPLAGRSATYLFRQLNDIQDGTRTGPGIALMKPVVAKLDQSDMIALAAYLASRNP